jgi:hypothetical protein
MWDSAQVGEPGPAARRAGDEEESADVEHPDLDAAGQHRLSTSARDVDSGIVGNLLSHYIHWRRL